MRTFLALAILCLMPSLASADCFHLPGRPVARTLNLVDAVRPVRTVIKMRPIRSVLAVPAKVVRVAFF